MLKSQSLGLDELRRAYREGLFTPMELVDELLARCAALAHNPIWITLLERDSIKVFVERLEADSFDDLPLYGIPFAIKDNIDLQAVPTTAACEAFRYIPDESAAVVERLLAAGAIPIGKTNLDQFATGLNGTRSPWGAVQNSIDPTYISGGSSSGSAVAVASSLVSFSLGTDTAGSGRIPAAFNNLVGLKPSKGLLSIRGVVPACRSLDCVSIFANSAADVEQVLTVAAGYDEAEPYSRPALALQKPVSPDLRLGIPKAEQLAFFGDDDNHACFDALLERYRQQGVTIVEVDYAPFLEAAGLLYHGPWVAERFAAIEAFCAQHADQLLPVIADIILPADKLTAVAAFKSMYELQACKKRADAELAGVDAILTPTAGTIYTIEAMLADPIQLNTNLGYYCNFMNLLDYCGLAIPAGFNARKLPFGVTLVAGAGRDYSLLRIAQLLQGQGVDTLLSASEPGSIDVVVCGAHMSGMPLNTQLQERQAVLLRQTRTASNYRFYALAGGPPYRPGLIRDESGGVAIEVEVWRMPLQHFGSFMQLIPHPLGIGTVELADGSWCKSFICEASAIDGARDISELGSWRRFIAQQQAQQ